MLMQPKRQKYRRSFRGDLDKVANVGMGLSFGDYGLKAVESGLLSAREIESARKTIAHYTKRGGKVWIRVFPYLPQTSKAAGVKMGSGKGNVMSFSTPVRAGSVIFEIVGISNEMAKQAFKLASCKLSVKTKFVNSEDEY